MKVVTAKNGGFCFGVRRAINAVCKNLDYPGNLYTLGPIIHNPQVVEEFKKKGVQIEHCVSNISNGTVVIRSHGVGENIYQQISQKRLRLVDATCPYVKRIHHLAKKYYHDGYNIIIVGQKEHPEVIGINGWCDNKAYIVYDLSDIQQLPFLNKACVLAQTTITEQRWCDSINQLQHKVEDLQIFNTICITTSERQKEAESIAKTVDVMWVIGGKNSSNTQKLYSICKTHCKKTFAIETAKDIKCNVIDPGDVIGIVAGASTPDWIIKEVVEKMSQLEDKDLIRNENEQNQEELDIKKAEDLPNESFDCQEVSNVADSIAPNENNPEETTSMEDFEKTMVSLRPGQVIKGTVLRVTDDEVIVNIGYKSDGVVPANQFALDSDQPLSEMVKDGDEIEVEVLKINDGEGNVLLSRKSLEQKKLWKQIEEGYKSGSEFKGVGVEVVKGGLIAKINGIRTFVPASQLSTRYVEDLSVFVDQTLKLRIIEIDKSRNRVVASQKVILQEEEEEARRQLWDSLNEGEKITGTVKRLTNFGAFVDIGGVDGLIHISDLSWGRIDHPSEVVKEDQEVEVVVLSVDRERERISLGYKQTLPHPWDNIDQKYTVGSIVTGKVARIASFGAFVQLEPGVDGLVHISQISNQRIDKVEDVLKIGDEVTAKVLDVNPEQRRISLSIREALPKKEFKHSDTKKAPEYDNEEMTVSLGDFFPDELTGDKK